MSADLQVPQELRTFQIVAMPKDGSEPIATELQFPVPQGFDMQNASAQIVSGIACLARKTGDDTYDVFPKDFFTKFQVTVSKILRGTIIA